ncbi:hypothetical protein Sjap_020599 [Stephania japonica]|uniref:Lipoxygenase domain-containing protein n=1 Tax=Stephania japonica TaxID=461633 RepID=A0AAP0F102_9MAGN
MGNLIETWVSNESCLLSNILCQELAEIQRMREEMSQSAEEAGDDPHVDETDLYYKVVGVDHKGRVYWLGSTGMRYNDLGASSSQGSSSQDFATLQSNVRLIAASGGIGNVFEIFDRAPSTLLPLVALFNLLEDNILHVARQKPTSFGVQKEPLNFRVVRAMVTLKKKKKKMHHSQALEGMLVLSSSPLKSINFLGNINFACIFRTGAYDYYATCTYLGNPDKGIDLARPMLGGKKIPYRRRFRTGRPPSDTS